MNTKIVFIKFSRTNINDYCWLIKADTIDQLDYRILEKIFSEYKSKQNPKENSVNCGLIELTSYFYFFSCYKTNYTDNYNREIYALDALCIKKENIDLICSLYFIFFSNPQKYIQRDYCLEDEGYYKNNNYTIDVKNIFENYLLLCKDIEKDVFFKINFCPTFRGFGSETQNKLLQILGNNNTRKIYTDSLNKLDEKKCTLFVIEKKRFLFRKFGKFIIKGDFNCKQDIIYIEKFFFGIDDLHNYVEEIIKKLDEYIVNVQYIYFN